MAAAAEKSQYPRPEPGKMYGLTHDSGGNRIIKRNKLLKVGIGLPKGPAVYVYIRENKWRVVTGFGDSQNVREFPLNERAAAEDFYLTARATERDCPYPRKTPFFMFSHQIGDGTFQADFDAIAAHGSMPTDMNVLFLDEDPFFFEYAMWGKSRKECWGDGRNAMRVHDRALSSDPQQIIDLFKQDRFFPVIGRCWTSGDCPYSKSTWEERNGRQIEKASLCKRSGDFKFQLLKCLRIGGTAYFHTTSEKSIAQLDSSLLDFRALTGGRLSTIPFVMRLRPFPTNHNGVAGTAYAVSLEFRADTVNQLRSAMLEGISKFVSLRKSLAGAPRMIEAAEPETVSIGTLQVEEEEDAEVVSEELQARGLTDEFYQPASEPVVLRSAAKPGPVPVVTAVTEIEVEAEREPAKPAAAVRPINTAAAPAARLSKEEFTAEELRILQFNLKAAAVALNRAQVESWLGQRFFAGEVQKALAEAASLAEAKQKQ